ncbi:unnamed protein product [Rotaria magnacalcarata]|nr:unnamed protein product [Rotaria magnacalcarata]
MEGSFFEKSGFASVNRKIFLSLIRYKNLDISIKPTDHLIAQDVIGLEALIVYSLSISEDSSRKTYSGAKLQKSVCYKNKTVVFRNSWPPILSDKPVGTVLIHHQPWEFHAVPMNWMPYLHNITSELWVPSYYCKNSYISNGVAQSKIHVIPHGVIIENYRAELQPLALPTRKTFKFLTIGGMLRRKGTDILLEAYKNLFSSEYDVTLIVHSIYGEAFGENIIKEMKANETAPEIIYINYPMSDMDMIRLYKSADVYVSPYRGEGFGITILEAMASGLPPIVTKYGPSTDFCPEDCVFCRSLCN